MKEELWKDIPGYEGFYEVSNLGRFKRIAGKRLRSDGVVSNLKEKFCTLHVCRKGYYNVTLSKNGSQKTIKAHRLVAKAFIPNPKNKKQVNHINCIKTDNNINNLEWCSGLENM